MTSSLPDRLVCFAHGKESGPWGTKITYLAEVARRNGYAVMSPDYRQWRDPGERVRELLRLRPQARRALILAGSSMGGYVTAMASADLQPQGVFLMAPALYFPGWDEEPPAHPAPTVVVHGWRDDIVPVERSLRYAQARRASLHILDSGHTLNDQLPQLATLFATLLRARLA